MEELLKILREIKPGCDFEGRVDLASSGELDSYDIVSLVSELEEKFDIDIPVEKIIPESFDSVEAIQKLIDSLK